MFLILILTQSDCYNNVIDWVSESEELCFHIICSSEVKAIEDSFLVNVHLLLPRYYPLSLSAHAAAGSSVEPLGKGLYLIHDGRSLMPQSPPLRTTKKYHFRGTDSTHEFQKNNKIQSVICISLLK